MKINQYILAITAFFCLGASVANAQNVQITPEITGVKYDFRGNTYLIVRDQNPDATIPEFYAKTSRACPPFCVQPLAINGSVETVAELELLAFLKDYVDTDMGYLIDSRTEDFYAEGTIPGAVNLSHKLLIPNAGNVFFGSIMQMLGGEQSSTGEWGFENPKDLMLFCNGPWCGQSPAAIRNLLAINYPADKLHYYRGGMQNWVSMGFTTIIP
ncbi:MAG: rhodanese-like domain-containing protein [Paracoccaceae bacterium]